MAGVKRSMNKETLHAETHGPDKLACTGLYIDVENVESIGRELISSLMQEWPDKAPEPRRLALYVRADSVDLWDAWATHAFPDVLVTVRGVQHYAKTGSKNSCDIAIAVEAMADLLLGRISHVAVLSDDTDFMSLYSAIRRERDGNDPTGSTPFLWLVTDRNSTRSTTVLEFFPESLMHVVRLPRAGATQATTEPEAAAEPPDRADEYSAIAEAILREYASGTHGSTAFQGLIKDRWPAHPMAKSNGAAYGTEFKAYVWPILQRAGAKMVSQKPNKYQLP